MTPGLGIQPTMRLSNASLPAQYMNYYQYLFSPQVDLPTFVINNVGKEGLKHLEMYLTTKQKGITQQCSLSVQNNNDNDNIEFIKEIINSQD